MGSKTLFICDKCGEETDKSLFRDVKLLPMNITIRLTKGESENRQHGGYYIERVWCPKCCENYGVKLDMSKDGREEKIQAPGETIEDKIIWFLEELGFRREE